MPSGLKKATPLLVFIAALLVIQNWWRIDLWLNPIAVDELSRQDVVMFSTSWCPYCLKARTFLRKANVPFIEHDIEKSPRAHQEYERISGRGVPVLKIGQTVIQGYDPTLMRKAIDQLNEQKSL